MTAERIVIFLIVAFSFALVVIMKQESIPGKLRRPLAVMGLFMVVLAFVLLLYSFFL